MYIDKLIRPNSDQKSTDCPITTKDIRKYRVIKDLIRKIFSFFGITLLKETSLKKINALLYSIEYNTAFARYFILEREQVDQVYAMVADNASRLSLDRYIKYRFALPLFYDIKNYNSYTLNTDYLLEIYKEGRKEGRIPSLQGADKKILDIVISQTFLAKQYTFDEKSLVTCGDTILDCGCFLGETAIYFAELLSGKGKIYSFEPDIDYFNAANKNIKKNGFDNIIEIVNAATSNNTIGGDYTPCYKEKVSDKISSITIDDFCLKNNISVDIIKMDIEGAEYNALVGARYIIQRDQPILMISAYHKPDDIITLSRFINDLDCGYSIYFRDRADFILFAIPPVRKERIN